MKENINKIGKIKNSLDKILEFDEFNTITNEFGSYFNVKKDGKYYVFDKKGETKKYNFAIKGDEFYMDKFGFSTGSFGGHIDLMDYLGTKDCYMGSKLLDFHGSSMENHLYGKNTRSITLSNTPYIVKSIINYSNIFEFVINDGKYFLQIKGEGKELRKNKDKLFQDFLNEVIKRKERGDFKGDIDKNEINKEVEKYSKFEYKEAIYINGDKINEGSKINTIITLVSKEDGDKDLNFYTILNTKTGKNDLYLNEKLIKNNATIPTYYGGFTNDNDLKLDSLQSFNPKNYFLVYGEDFKKASYMSGDKELFKLDNGVKQIYFDNDNGNGLKKDTLNGIYIQDHDDNIIFNGKNIGKYKFLINDFLNKNIFLALNDNQKSNGDFIDIINDGKIIGYTKINKIFKGDIVHPLYNSFKENQESFYFTNKNKDNKIDEYLLGYKDGKQVIFKNFEIIKEIDKDKEGKYFYLENDIVKCKIIEK